MADTITVDDVKRFLRDYGEYNILLDEVEFTDDDVDSAKRFTIARFNARTPLTSYTADSFPNEWVLLMGIASHLMSSEAFLQLRNQVNFNDGGLTPVGIDDKFAAYVSLRNALSAEWSVIVGDMKQQMNMEGCYGSVWSGYRYIKPGTRNP